ncbi:hypothetical protein Vretimale_16823, partial [Volvox reticuliferus]
NQHGTAAVSDHEDAASLSTAYEDKRGRGHGIEISRRPFSLRGSGWVGVDGSAAIRCGVHKFYERNSQHNPCARHHRELKGVSSRIQLERDDMAISNLQNEAAKRNKNKK